jgi:hypothetical protein
MDSGLLSLLTDFAASHGWAGDVARFLAQDAIFILIAALAIIALRPGSVLGRRVPSGPGSPRFGRSESVSCWPRSGIGRDPLSATLAPCR